MGEQIKCPNCNGKGYNKKIIKKYDAYIPCDVCNMQGIIDSDETYIIQEDDGED